MGFFRFTIITLIFFLFSFKGYMSTKEAPWLLVKNEKEVKVYSRCSTNSNFKEIKVETNINAPLSVIVALLRDVPAFPSWVYKCESSHIIKQPDNQSIIYYQKSDVPWPVSDRDMVVKSCFRQDPTTKIVYFNSSVLPDLLPEQADVVRIRKFQGSWKLTPKTDGTVNIEYQIGVDPGGLIPAWIVNMASTDGPFITTLNLKQAVKNPKYQQARLAYIQELD